MFELLMALCESDYAQYNELKKLSVHEFFGLYSIKLKMLNKTKKQGKNEED